MNISKTNRASLRILVIEDQDDQWLLTKRALNDTIPQAQIHRVNSADGAITYLNDQLHADWTFPQLIMLDLYIPQAEQGWCVLRSIRDLPSPFNRVPVILFTNSDNIETIEKAYQLGATSYLVKPIEYNQWLDHFTVLRDYWLNTATIAPLLSVL